MTDSINDRTLDGFLPGDMCLRAYELAFWTTPVGMSFVTLDRRSVLCNSALCAFLGRSAEELASASIDSVTHPDDVHLHEAAHAQLLAGDIDRYALDKRYVHKDGRVLWAHLQVAAVKDDAGVARVLISQVVDLTEFRAQTDRLRWHATHDSLTGLANRSELLARLPEALARSRGGPALALLFIDLDGFKAINDRHGHAIGDRVLQQVALRIAETLRPGDIAARIGGDEFVVIIESIEDAEGAAALARRILARIGSAEDTETTPLHASIGVALANGGDAEALLRRADAAMYLAKSGGRNRFVVSAP